MTPYSELAYFIIVVVLAAMMMLPKFRGRGGASWIAGSTLLMLLLQGTKPLEIVPGVVVWEVVALAVFGMYMLGIVRLTLAKVLPKKSLVLVPLGLIPLIVAKYLPLFAEWFPATVPDVHFGFTGISYVSFRALDVLFSLSDGVLAEVNALDFLAFLFFFPTVSSGPVDRFKRFRTEWRAPRTSEKFWSDLDAGVALIFRGLLYKFIIATKIDQHLLGHVGKTPGLVGVIEYAYVYSAYLFFDFAGYSAFAIGVSRWFGIRSPENFNAPFLARNIRDFWNRWHMSLSFWFRDHVYTRFTIAAVKGRWFRKREVAGRLGYFVSFGLMGVWHVSQMKRGDDAARFSESLGWWPGLTWHHLLYGIYHAALFNILDTFAAWKKKNPGRFAGRGWDWAARILTLQAVVFGFWLFSGHGWVTQEQSDAMHRMNPAQDTVIQHEK